MVSDFEEVTYKTDLSEEIVGNPLQTFQLIKRLTVNFNNVHDVMKTNQWTSNETAGVEDITHFYEMAAKIHDELLPDYSKNATLTEVLAPPLMRFVDGDNEDYRRYQALYRGDKLRTPAQDKDLYCYVTNSNNPWLFIQPVKVEVMSLSPRVVMYHELMTASESEHIRELAAPMLQRAKVQTDQDQDEGKEEVPGARTSQTAWFSSG